MKKFPLLILLVAFGAVAHSFPTKKTKDPSCNPGPKHMRAAVRHIEAGGIGYDNGYTTLEAFIANDPFDWSVMPFIDVRGHVFNDGRFAANTGIGARALWGCRAYGINAYYDYRQGFHKGYSQVALGLETLGSFWDLRVNGYLPVGGKVSYPYDIGFAGFEGNSILVQRKFEYSMKGIDGEVGFHFGKTEDFDFYTAAGPYYFNGKLGKSTFGGKIRAAGSYKDFLTLEIMDSFDRVFHNNFQGQLTFTVPFGPRSKPNTKKNDCLGTCDYAITLAERMIQPVEREEIVVLNTHRKTEAASLFLVFVDNLSSSAGTFESPYPTLAEAQANSAPGDIIYVFPGDGTTAGMNAGITLKNNQKLWGSSAAHLVDTNLGSILIPRYTTLSPSITNPAGSGVTLAQNNEISGLFITYCLESGITGDNAGNVRILSSTISYNNQTDAGFSGIVVNFDGDSKGSVLVDNVIVSNNTYSGVASYLNDDAKATLTVQNCTLTGNFYPIDFESYNSSIGTFNFNNNLVTDNDDYFYIYTSSANASAQTFNFNHNQVINTFDDYSIFLQVDSGAVGSITMKNNTFDSNDFAVDLILSTTAAVNLDIQDNRFINTLDDSGLYISHSGNGLVQGTISYNTFQNNASNYGFAINQGGGGTMCLDMRGNAGVGNMPDNYSFDNSSGTLKISPCNAEDLNSGGLLSNAMNVDLVQSCPSGAPCTP